MVVQQQINLPNLWHEALKTLSYDEQQELEFARGTTHPTPTSVLAAITDKKNECVKKQWVLYVNKKGEKIMIRELFNGISDWIHRFRTIGDVAVQYDSAHAALPWAAVRFFLQVMTILHFQYDPYSSLDRCERLPNVWEHVGRDRESFQYRCQIHRARGKDSHQNFGRDEAAFSSFDQALCYYITLFRSSSAIL